MAGLRAITIALLVCLVGSAAHAVDSSRNPITLDQMRQMFDRMRAKTNWNLDGPLLWGYFFTDEDPGKLRAAADELVANGYTFVKLYLTKDNRTHFLHVEKVERHTPESLDRRNQDLYRLAAKHRLRSYDGMDVGPAP